MKKMLFSLLAVMFVANLSFTQVIKPVKWTFSTRQVDAEQVDLLFKATIESPWHMYGLHIKEGGPIPTSVIFSDTTGFAVMGKPTQSPKPELVDDPIFNMRLELHSKQAVFTQRIRILKSDSVIISGTVEFMTCDDKQCVLGDNDFTFRLKGSGKSIAAVEPKKEDTNISSENVADVDPVKSIANGPFNNSPQPAPEPSGKSLWGVFFLAMLAGLGGLLTPCVYPMIPMTVSYFLRGNKTKTRAVSQALVFGISIMLIYTLIGVLVAVFKNPNAVNNFTTHWITNLVFFFIFLILSASFFGMFEIMLPSSLANSVDRQADKGGYIGAFFMALAMTMLSFSCTGPIVASLLIKASQGEVLEPIVGMAGFSFIFALPFTLFAIFPTWLQNLPKSGSWLNAIKVFFAFVLLAFSLYFIGKIDQAYHLNLLSRNLFLSIWIVIWLLLGFYLLGKIKFVHDNDLPHIGLMRFVVAIMSFSFAVYLFTGLLGNELKALSTILPPPETTTKVTSENSAISNGSSFDQICGKPKYNDFLSLPSGLQGYFDYHEALACARQQGKPVLVDFVGHTCANCKKMYSEVWSDPQVLELLKKEFIIAALYTDDKTKLPEIEHITSRLDGKIKNTIGKINQDLQIERFHSNALPLYAIVDSNGNDLSKSYYNYNSDINKFISWLQESIK
jgi:thiol:disulfide interchange protein